MGVNKVYALINMDTTWVSDPITIFLMHTYITSSDFTFLDDFQNVVSIRGVNNTLTGVQKAMPSCLPLCTYRGRWTKCTLAHLQSGTPRRQ